MRAAAWLRSWGGVFFFFGCFLAREASDWRSEYVFLRSLGMPTVSHRSDPGATPVDLKLHHYQFPLQKKLGSRFFR